MLSKSHHSAITNQLGLLHYHTKTDNYYKVLPGYFQSKNGMRDKSGKIWPSKARIQTFRLTADAVCKTNHSSLSYRFLRFNYKLLLKTLLSLLSPFPLYKINYFWWHCRSRCLWCVHVVTPIDMLYINYNCFIRYTCNCIKSLTIGNQLVFNSGNELEIYRPTCLGYNSSVDDRCHMLQLRSAVRHFWYGTVFSGINMT